MMMASKPKDLLMDHFLKPRNVGEITNPSGVGNVGNPLCGDIVRFYIQVQEGRITKAMFKTFGCRAAIATSSILTQIVTGLSLENAMDLTEHDVAEALGDLPPLKIHCARLATYSLKASLADYHARQTGDRAELERILQRTRDPREWSDTPKDDVRYAENPL